jgi:NADH:ubiquinone oxidoreductase subunit K
MITLHHVLLVSAILFSIGLLGALSRRNAVLMLVSIEIMMNAANLNFVAFWRYGAIDVSGLAFALFAIVVAGAESAVGLALVVAVYRHLKSVDTEELRSLRG